MKRTRGNRRGLIVVAAIIVTYAVAGFVIVPRIARTQAEKRLTAALGRSVSIGNVRMNPFALSATIEDFDVREKGGASSFLGWGRLYVRFDALRSLAGAWVIGDVELERFHAGIVVNPDGSFNFSDLLAAFTAPAVPAPAPGRPLLVVAMRVEDARVSFVDRSLHHPFSTEAGPLTFSLANFETTGDRGASCRFEARTEAGERFAWSGTLAASPVACRGDFEADDILLKKYMPYLEGRTRADILDGKLTARGSFNINFDPKNRVLALDKAELHVRGLRVAERSTGRAVLELGALDVDEVSADGVAPKASAGRLALADGHVHVSRDAKGGVNLVSLAQPVGVAPVAAASEPATPKVLVGVVSLDRFTVDVVDEAVGHAAKLSLGNLKLSLGNVTLDDGAAMPLHLAFAWAPKGDVAVDGTLKLRPRISADLKAKVAGFELLPLSPYLEQVVNAQIVQGTVSSSASIRISLPAGTPDVALQGDFSADNFGMVDAAHKGELLGFARLALTGIDVGTAPRISASVSQVELSKPYAHVVVRPDGSLNISSLVVAPSGSHGADRGATPPAPRVEIGRVTIDGGEFSFTDHSIEPNVRMTIGGFSGTVSGLSSENLARADVNLYGMVGGVGPVDITGKLDPLGEHRFVDLKVDVKSVDLVPLSPYSGKFAGYELARGQLVVDSRILLDGSKVDAANRVTVNQFTFGAATQSKDATTLPVRLGVALLKDVDGRIFIDLPVEGNLEDPEFRVGKVVLRVVVNLLTKAAVSPFSLIGSMFGGGGEELAYQEFSPGASDLLQAQQPRLDTLAKALANRPGLSLGIEGGYDSAADTYALRRIKLDTLVRRQTWEARHATDPNIPPPDKLAVSPEEYAATVKRLFNAKFPPGTKFGTPLPPPPGVSGPPPGPPPGLLREIVYLVTFQKERDEAAAKKESEHRVAEHNKAVASAVANALPMEEMSGRLAEAINVTSDDLGALAAARAQRVRDHLVNDGHIAPDRLFLVKGPESADQGPRVRLSFQ